MKHKTKVVVVIKSVFSLMALLMLATLVTGASSSFQTTLAQPTIMGGSNMSMGNAGSAGMNNFNPMSLANNIFNASSLYGSVGISMVNGVKVTSISLSENNEISVTLTHSAVGNAATTNNVNASNTTMSSPSPPSPRVTVTAIRAPLNIKDLASLASQSSKMMMAANNNTSNAMSNSMMMGGGPMQGFEGAANNGTNNVNPLSFLSDLQIGSSNTVANADWKLPQVVRMGLTDMMGGTTTNSNSNRSTASTADFIIVTVIPYTGK